MSAAPTPVGAAVARGAWPTAFWLLTGVLDAWPLYLVALSCALVAVVGAGLDAVHLGAGSIRAERHLFHRRGDEFIEGDAPGDLLSC